MSHHTYQCTCVAGFANGVCEYGGDTIGRCENRTQCIDTDTVSYVLEYEPQCTVLESDDNPDDPTLSGNCDIDVDECKSFPCKNGATCTDSTTESAVSYHAYQCTCVAGFANGVCEYDFISEYTAQCSVQESDDGTYLSLIHI
mgnify:CR=1 FL=1